MSSLTIWIILGVVHVMLTTLFIVKIEDWFGIDDDVHLLSVIFSIGVIAVCILIIGLLVQYPIVLAIIIFMLGLPIGIAWLIKKVRK